MIMAISSVYRISQIKERFWSISNLQYIINDPGTYLLTFDIWDYFKYHVIYSRDNMDLSALWP